MDHQRTPAARTIGRMIGRTLLGLLVALVGAVGVGSTASAGGWAVTTLDSTPAIAPGESVDVGFTIRQHGVTPVDLDEGVTIQVTAADGAVEVFPAALDGPQGHYVATVTLAEGGDYTWAVQQGWFAPQDLGTLTVASSSVASSSGASAGHRLPAVARYGLPLMAAVAGAAAIADLIAGRRRRTVPA